MNKMNRNIMNWKQIKKKIINAPHWIINLDEYDCRTFEGDGSSCIKVIEAVTREDSEVRFDRLVKEIEVGTKQFIHTGMRNLKILVFLQFPISMPILMTELSRINDLIEQQIPQSFDYEIKYGLSPREDELTRIILCMAFLSE